MCYRGARTGSAADTEINATREKATQHAEVLSYLQRAVMRKHDAATTNSDEFRPLGHRSNHYFRAVTGQPGRCVVLGQPVSFKPPSVCRARQFQRVSQCIATPVALGYRRLVKNAELERRGHYYFDARTPQVLQRAILLGLKYASSMS